MEGPRLAGITRTLPRAAQAYLPDHLAAGFTDEPWVSPADMIALAGRWATKAQAAGTVTRLDTTTAWAKRVHWIVYQ